MQQGGQEQDLEARMLGVKPGSATNLRYFT